MNRPRLKHILMESGLCFDRVRLLDWLLTHTLLRTFAFRFLRLRFSPAILKDALRHEVDTDEAGRLFSLGISYINVGDTYKTTRSDRTFLTDNRLLSLAKTLNAPSLLEVGVSDGTSSLALLGKGNHFSRVLLTDKFSHFFERKFPFGSLYYDSESRLLGIKFLCFYINVALSKQHDTSGLSRIETVNPLVVKFYGVGAIGYFDVFKAPLDEPVQLIKCSNVLNMSYFSKKHIIHGLFNLSRSLTENGYLIVSHNNEKYSQGEALLVLVKKSSTLQVIENINSHELSSLFSDGFLLEPHGEE